MASTSSGTAVQTPPDSTTPASAPIATKADAPVEKTPDDSSKLRTFLGILRRFIGVTDIAAVRFSLPAQLLEPMPNLEYWQYLDRPETFISIPDHQEPVDRMLAVLRFWFTKDLKYVKGRPCKPYNSTLGEFFRCNWELDEPAPPISSAASTASKSGAASSAASVSSFKSATEGTPASKDPNHKIKISFLTEQTSHHPPVSAFWIDCPEKGIYARGYDQLSAKFTGTAIRVTPGNHNLGIFIHLKDGEEYLMTHPAVNLGGFLRGSLSISVADTCYVTCPKTQIKVILEYLEEGWLGKAQNKVQGAIFRYDPENDNKTKIKDVPEKDVLGRIEGSWTEKLYYSIGSAPFAKAANKVLLLDLGPLNPVPKVCPPETAQLPNESRRFWGEVTDAILSKQFSHATNLKVAIEERQRQKAAERKAAETEWQPRFFTGAVTPVGKPELTEDGKLALKRMQEEDWELEPNKVLGA